MQRPDNKRRSLKRKARDLVPDAIVPSQLSGLREVNTTATPVDAESPEVTTLRWVKEEEPLKFLEMLHKAEEGYRKRCEEVNERRAAFLAAEEAGKVVVDNGLEGDGGVEKCRSLIGELLSECVE